MFVVVGRFRDVDRYPNGRGVGIVATAVEFAAKNDYQDSIIAGGLVKLVDLLITEDLPTRLAGEG